MGSYKKVWGVGWLIASEKLMTVYLLQRQLFSTKIFGRKQINESDNNKKKSCSVTRLGKGIYERDFYSHVLANPVTYTLPIFSSIRGRQCGDAT